MSDQMVAAPRDLGLVGRPPGAGGAIRTRRFSRKRALLLGVGLILAAGAARYGHQWWTVGRFIESTDDAYVGGDITVLAPKVAGFIATVAITDNQMVHAGDLLIRLDDRDYRAALAKAEAGVATQQAKLGSNDADRRLQAAMMVVSQVVV